MRLVTSSLRGADVLRLGAWVDGRVFDLNAEPPARMKHPLSACPSAADPARFAAALLDERAIRCLASIPDAGKFVCVGRNYRQHLEELKRIDLLAEMPREPTAFFVEAIKRGERVVSIGKAKFAGPALKDAA